MVLNPFRSNKKWRHKSTTVEMRDEQDNSISKLDKKNQTLTAAAGVAAAPFNSDSLLNGIGDYIFHSPLGVGKFSKVMLAYHYLTGEKVAIKVINKRAHAYRIIYRLVREIELMQILDHENIVKLYETYETADALYLIMEYVEGYNLEEYLKKIKKGIMSEDELVIYFVRWWVIHRDLKTPNILLTSATNQVKLADFGLGNRFGLQRLKTVCGSMLYYSPEISTAKSYIGPEIDTWCLGVMLFRMTAGRELFSHAKSPSELKKYIISQNYTLPSHISQELGHTIQKCLSMNRYDRLSLKTFLSNDPWFNNFGALEDIFEEHASNCNYNALEATESLALSTKTDDTNQIYSSAQNYKKQCKQDLQVEKQKLFKIPKTIIYHILHPSTYFTSSSANHSSKHPIDLKSQFETIHELNKNLLDILKQVQLCSIQDNSSDLKSPISHLFRKQKKKEDLPIECSVMLEQNKKQLLKSFSALNLSQLYQRVTKDHISYFTIQCNSIHTGSSTTVISNCSASSSTFVSEKKSHHHRPSFSMNNLSNTLPDMTTRGNLNHELQDTNQLEMIKILRLACEILGITFYQATSTKLVCLLTIRNDYTTYIKDKRLSHSNLYPPYRRFSILDEEDTVPYPRHCSTISAYSSQQSSEGWWSRQKRRLSAPFLLQQQQQQQQQSSSSLGLSSTPGLVLGNSSHHDLLSMGRAAQEKIFECSENEDRETSSFVLLTMDVVSLSKRRCNKSPDENNNESAHIVAVKYSKIKGSNKIFKLVKSWMQMILTQNRMA
ncbi:kinase-like domain-containing protein [Cokeromyces recurvatus]|uniref:kinase-like domain-containing protein n=1 Tax=Cokeromyces recurvatus TaxID=90255 RepID=UPI0022209B20|nr:kinase-like domain-containing protein [Cokeromyces recurvatus]XP_051380200.1 kinase-like domain-containing protein [Cokeromyces recurvatus]KAI7899071.1 kinase-like domain-containing protein [Cokeromyces recurvatus]KAI7900215.1 kinase-like domain-containing protein [Cokeromyces recurvatus]